ncbi:MAG: phosphatase PAP2 family protein [Acidobacteriota bacterium]|nr:phosphatase PAP2 family protein [Acidobacteriota bacterium]
MTPSVPFLRPQRAARRRLVAMLSAAVLLASCLAARAQSGPNPGPNPAALPDAPQSQSQSQAQAQSQDAITIRNTPRNILHDQLAIWTSPARLRVHDLKWLAPLAVATGISIATDHRAMTDVVSHDPSFNQANVNASNAMIGGFIAAPVALYGFGHFRADDHAREAGILSGEALIDGVGVEEGMKLIFWRERPALDSAHGKFFQSGAGIDSSFPSSHSVLAWATASAIATEYPSLWTQTLVYSGATAISLTRVMGQEHFPTDVLVGAAAGWLVGRYVVHHHRHALATR